VRVTEPSWPERSATRTSKDGMGFINLHWLGGSLIPRETADQPGARPQLSLRCADVHPVTCDAQWTATSASELVAKAVDHGLHAHGFDPRWYTRKRIAAIRRAATSTHADGPPDVHSETDKTAGRTISDLPIDEAAAVLCVSPDTLRAWEQRFGYPHPVSDAAGERRYALAEVIALRDSLQAGLSITAAVQKARGVGADG
jgi:DNA-binding transcriptional regulator YiaG